MTKSLSLDLPVRVLAAVSAGTTHRQAAERFGVGQVIQIDEARIRGHLGEMVQGTVEEALNAMLDAEADRLCGAARYERSDARQDTRAGYYERSLDTKAGPVSLRIPKPDIRHRDHRALPAARGFSRRSLD